MKKNKTRPVCKIQVADAETQIRMISFLLKAWVMLVNWNQGRRTPWTTKTLWDAQGTRLKNVDVLINVIWEQFCRFYTPAIIINSTWASFSVVATTNSSKDWQQDCLVRIPNHRFSHIFAWQTRKRKIATSALQISGLFRSIHHIQPGFQIWK